MAGDEDKTIVRTVRTGVVQINASVATRVRLKALAIQLEVSQRALVDKAVEEYYEKKHKPWLGGEGREELPTEAEAEVIAQRVGADVGEHKYVQLELAALQSFQQALACQVIKLQRVQQELQRQANGLQRELKQQAL